MTPRTATSHSAPRSAPVPEERRSDAAPAQIPTLWGLTPVQIHDRFWAARGVQVVRTGEESELVPDVELYLLLDPRSLVAFRIGDLVETLSWVRPDVLLLRLSHERRQGYRERAKTGPDGQFRGFTRIYDGVESRLARAALTPSASLARAFQAAESPREGWRRLRRSVDWAERSVRRVSGRVYDAVRDEDLARFAEDIVRIWRRPDATIRGVRRAGRGVWAFEGAAPNRGAHVLAPVWIGAGRNLSKGDTVMGPAVLWDDPAARPQDDGVEWEAIEPLAHFKHSPARAPRHPAPPGKRLFDVLFALVVLAVTLPFYPIVMLAILIEDGWPVFFAHRRETLGGREFPCIKFRSMRKDADRMKARLAAENQADGPQFFMERDPRLTRVGRVIRALQVDELPQFLNVLVGHMSVVGPRPSPRKENQYCPPWREARLSVRPGVTGLWQVERTREAGVDFQEWIRFDLEYVRNASWRLDLRIILRTVGVVFRGGRKRR